MTSSNSMLLGGAGGSRRRRQLLGGTALAAAAVLALAGPIASAMAASGGQPSVQTSETVKAELDSSGKLDVARVFSQVAATGHGRVSVQDPTSTVGLRNLDGWGSPSTEDGKVSYDFSVDGTKRFRTVADFTKDLPVSVEVAYTLDGKEIDPDDLAGKSGKVGVTYHISNTTAEPTELTYKDGLGNDVTETVDVVTPYVGQLAIDLPSSFRNIASTDDRADQAGDGHGGRILTFTMVLFEPIGQVEQELGFTADVDDAAIPAGHIQIVPVSPQNHPELKFGQDGFASGAQSGQDLASGSAEIDKNVLKLRDGAAKLLDGLQQLQTGADQLSAGLTSGVPQAIDGGRQLAQGAMDAADGGEKVAAGAKRVAAGNKKLSDGLGALAGGAGQLQTGAHQLSDGAAQLSAGFENPDSDEDLVDGSQALAGALGLISVGLAQLNDASSGLPAAKAGLVALRAGIDHPVGATGPTDPGGLYQVLQQIAAGISNPLCDQANPADPTNPCGVKEGLASLNTGLTTINDGLQQVAGGLDNPSCNPACGVKQGVAGVKTGLDGALVPGTGSIDELIGAVTAAKATTGCMNDAACQTYLAGVLGGLSGSSTSLKEQTQTASATLGAVLTGLDIQLIPGVADLIAGVTDAQTGLATIRAGVDRLAAGSVGARDGVKTLVLPGIDQLIAGLTSAVTGVGQLAPGAAAANEGAGDLAFGISVAGDGAAQLASGAAQLSGGLDQVAAKVPDAVTGAQALAKGSAALAEGSAELAEGLSGQLAPGAQQLSDGLAGLQAAADGSSQIADGLAQAKDGNQQIVDGAGRLSEEGTSQLVQAGDEAARNYGREYAVMQALNTKGKENAMPYGAPEGSSDNRAAYDITIAPVGHESGLGSAGRGVAGLVVLGLGALAATLIRGRFA